MGIFDKIKNAFGTEEPEKDVTVGPSQLLREAGIDPSGLKFGFGTGSISVSGELADEANRQKIIDTLSAIKGISKVDDHMVVASATPAPAEPPAAAEGAQVAGGGAPEPADAAEAVPAGEARTYTVKSGDSLWKISEEMYGNGSKYMAIFEANKGLLENPDKIFPGQELVIPELED